MSYIHGHDRLGGWFDVATSLAVPLPIPTIITSRLPDSVRSVVQGSTAQTQLNQQQAQNQQLAQQLAQAQQTPAPAPAPYYGPVPAPLVDTGMSPLMLGGIAVGVLGLGFLAYKAFGSK